MCFRYTDDSPNEIISKRAQMRQPASQSAAAEQSLLTGWQIESALWGNSTVFFDSSLSPLVPAAGQVFLEVSYELQAGKEVVVEGDLVEYIGPEQYDPRDGNICGAEMRFKVRPIGASPVRRPAGDILILHPS